MNVRFFPELIVALTKRVRKIGNLAARAINRRAQARARARARVREHFVGQPKLCNTRAPA